MARDIVIIHYLHEAEDGPMGTGPDAIAPDPQGVFAKIGESNVVKRRMRFACNGKAVINKNHAGSGSLVRGAGDQLTITCPACLESDRFKRDLAEYEARLDPNKMFTASGECCG